TRAPSVWSEATAPLGNVANFGISGDRTQFVLWRITHGELDGCGARVVVLLIGTNNLEAASAEGVVHGIAANVAALRAKLPSAIIVLNALFPRGAPDDPLRAKLAEVNAKIKPLADGEHVMWVDAGAGFLDADARLRPDLMADGLHPTPAGYEVWASALRPVLDEALSK
ncbi:MAG TPA: GDSL-type esterase/lipase family protein, partial [Candidatus Acidoferrum sp.]|nr:GDSL-type esterase/lipase family protein [Candidatus Acidoferrum sp.]